MIELSKKVLLVLMVIPVLVVIFAIACWQNWGGIGSALAGFGGPVGSGGDARMEDHRDTVTDQRKLDSSD